MVETVKVDSCSVINKVKHNCVGGFVNSVYHLLLFSDTRFSRVEKVPLYLKDYDLIIGSLWNILNCGCSDSFPPTRRRGHRIPVLMKPVKNEPFCGAENKGWCIMNSLLTSSY